MSSPLENRFQKTSLGKDQTPYLACEKPGREAASGSRRPRGDARRKDCCLGKSKQGQGQNTGNTPAISGSSEFATENCPENRVAFFWEAIRPIYGNGSEDKFLFYCLPYERKNLFSSQDIQDSSARRRLKPWSKTNAEICVEA